MSDTAGRGVYARLGRHHPPAYRGSSQRPRGRSQKSLRRHQILLLDLQECHLLHKRAGVAVLGSVCCSVHLRGHQRGEYPEAALGFTVTT